MIKKYLRTVLFLTSVGLSTTSYAGSTSSVGLGIEGFHDIYKEGSLDLETTSEFGSITGYYSRQGGGTFLSLDARVSYGTNDYESPSGKLSGVPQWEGELRGRFGLIKPLWGGTFSPYTGLGVRYFRDEGKGYFTDTGSVAYDRRILQAYVPIGASLSYVTSDGWTITPQAEVDLAFYGNVDSRLTNAGIVSVPGYGLVQYLDPANNRQKFGAGFRSELMFGKAQQGYSWQVGPFVRYWYFGESEDTLYTDTSGNPAITVVEPENTRTQIGVAARILW